MLPTLLRKAIPTAQESLIAAIGALPTGKRALLGELLALVVSEAWLSGESPEFFFEGEAEEK